MHALLDRDMEPDRKTAIAQPVPPIAQTAPPIAPARYVLPGILLLALTLRVIAAFQPGFHHPDAIYQYLEPAYRLVTGQGVVTWEWRVGMRSWLLPALLAGPVALGNAIDPHGEMALVLPRICMGVASLGIVWAAWRHGMRHSRDTGVIAAFVAAIWFEFIHLGVQTLAEPLATACFMVASVFLAERGDGGRDTRRGDMASGALLVAMVLLRPHYAPAGLVLLAFSWWPLRHRPLAALRDLIPFFASGIAVAALAGGIDWVAGGQPFAWIIENARQNVVENVAARYGTAPPLALIAWLIAMWQWWIVPIAIGVRFGWRKAPALVIAAAVTIALHSLIGHKEYRFIFLSVTSLIIVSTIGWGVILDELRRRWPHRARPALTLTMLGWGIASILLAFGPDAREQRDFGVDGSRMYATMRADPRVCGIAILNRASFADFPGQVGLGRDISQSMFWGKGPTHRNEHAWAEAAAHGSAFNRILASSPHRGKLPPGYRELQCGAPGTDGEALCLYGRAGGCTPDPQSPYEMNRALVAEGA